MDKNKSGKFYVLWHFNWLLWHLWSWFQKFQHGEAYVGEAYIPGEHFPARWRPLLNGCSLLVVAKLLRTCSPESARLQKRERRNWSILFFCTFYSFLSLIFYFHFSHPFLFQTFFHLFRCFRCLFSLWAGSTLHPGISPWSPFHRNILEKEQILIFPDLWPSFIASTYSTYKFYIFQHWIWKSMYILVKGRPHIK